MKHKILLFLSGFFLSVLTTLPVYGAAVVSGSNGVNASYATLGAAFKAINGAASQAGYNISIQITSNLAETTNPTLNAGTWTSMVIYPTGTYSITRSNDGNFISLNGAKNVTFDGRINQTGSTNSLTITNTKTGTRTATLSLYGSAQNNIFKYCNINGGIGSATNGTIAFGTGTNSGNTIDHCIISNNSARRPIAIYSVGGTNSDNNIITNNQFNSTWITSGSSYSIYLTTGNSGWNISDNSFYNSGIGTLTGTSTYSNIYINNTSGNGFTISRNYIGGESALCGGNSMSMGTSSAVSTIYNPIYLNVGSTTASTVQNNVIQNVNFKSTNTAPFTGINLVAGNASIDGNTLGSSTGLVNLTLTAGTTLSSVYGIYTNSTGTVNITNNIFSSIILAGSTATNANSFYGIYKTSTAGTLTLTGNVIGNDANAGSVTISSTGTAAAQSLYGIYSACTGSANISNNTVANLVNATTNTTAGTAGTTTGIYSSAGANTVSNNKVHDLSIANANTSTSTPSVCGLLLTSTSAGKTVSGNTVYKLSNTYSGASALGVFGIYYSGATTGTNVVSRNFIHSLSASNTSASIYGLYINSGVTTYSNNILSLGSTTSDCGVYGVYDVGAASNTTSFFYNSVYIGGTSTSSNSYGLYNPSGSNTRDYRNNIFYNCRSKTSSGSHYAMYIGVAGSITANYNEYYVSGTGGVLGYYAAAKTTLPIVTGQDANSLNTGPSIFRNAGGTAFTDYKPQTQLAGVNGTGVTVDFGNVTRTIYTMGAWEVLPVEIWNGTTYLAGYTTLKQAFDKVNDGTWTGDLLCKIVSSTTETTSATLNASSAPSNYSSLLVYPTATGLTIGGTISGALIALSGADNVTIDGRVNATGSTVSLVVNNTNASGSAISLNNSAQNNVIQYCTLQGSGTNGIVYFPTDASSGSTNYNNTITNCLLTSSTGRVTAAISIPNIGTATYNGLTILNNSIYNTWNGSATSYGIFINPTTASSGITISGNSFYETTDFQPTGTFNYYGVYIDNNNANGFTVSNNYFGGQAALSAGSAMLLGNSATAQSLLYIPIRLKVGSTSASSIQGNTIRNISFKSSSALPFTGIHVEGGMVNVGTETGNTIGAATGTGSVLLTGTATLATSYGINVNSSADVNVSNNIIGSVTLTNAAANAHSFYGIAKYNGAAGVLTVSGNSIGSSTTASSILSSSASTGNNQFVIGIGSSASGNVEISENTISNLGNNTTRDNAGALVYGIYATGGNANTVSGNFVFNLNCASTGTTNVVAGLCVESGTMTCANNIIYIGGGITTGLYEISGIKAKTSALPQNFYHNTVYISGTLSGSTSVHSAAFNKSYTGGTVVLYNNIFFNARTGGTGTGKHIALYVANTAGLTSDYNIFHAPNTNGVLCMSGTTAYTTIVDWRTFSGTDPNTANANPTFTLAGGTVPANYKLGLSLPGFSGTGVTTDFGGTDRMLWTAGAWESALNQLQVWNGTILRASYVTLKDAFDKINDGTWTGALTIKINANATETASAVLNASGTGSANYSSLLIYPQKSGITITGNLNAPLIQLNGADYVNINGSVYLNNTTAGMTLVNTNAGTSASTIKFSESAQNNCIEYCVLKGNPASATQGVVIFSTSASGTGINTDTIANCKISGTGSSTATRPYNAIYSAGSLGRTNSGILISANEFLDFLNPGVASNGILISDYSTNFTISGNSFYETAAFTSTAGVSYNVININNSIGGRYVIQNNFIGGNAALCSGTWTKSGNNNAFTSILLNVANTVRTSVQGNTIKGFKYTNTANADWTCISVTSGGVDIGTVTGNSFGESEGTGSITLTNCTSNGSFYGIYIASANMIDCENNTFGSISAGTGTSTLSMNLYGIFKTATAGDMTVNNNSVGSENTENSLIARSISSANIQNVYGIYSASTGNVSITGNIVSNLVNATTSNQISLTRGIYTVSGSNTIDNNEVHHISSLNSQANNYTNATLIGIEQISEQSGSTQLIRGNSVYSLKNISFATIELYGIFYKGPATGTHEISRNFVNTFIIISTDAAYLHGISLHTGTYTCDNNVVYLGDTITTGCHIWGIWNNSNSPVNIFHNTVYLNGTSSTGSSNSFAYRDISNAPTARTIENNIFWDARINTLAVSHYAIYLANPSNSTINYNDYQFAENFGLIESTEYATQDDWVTGTGFDINSISIAPELTNLGGVSPSDYQIGVALPGTPIAGITTDFGFLDRSLTSPTMGAWEFVPNPVEVWNGATFRHDYANLKQAFDALNAATWTGDLTLKIKANIKETAPAVLYQSGYTGAGGTSNYSRVHIYPKHSYIQVLGNLASSMIELNGAKGVVFDGRVNGTGTSYNLTLQNDAVSASASTILFVNSAELDSVKYCKIKGLSTNPNGGIVVLSTSSTGNGNDNNCIYNNKITVVDTDPAVKSRVINGVYSEGTSGRENSGNCIKDNEVYDVWSEGASSNGILIGSNSTAFTISGNSIYEVTTFTPSAANSYSGIRINNTSGNDFIVTGNYIGGKAIYCEGNALLIGTNILANTFDVLPLRLNVGSASATSVQGNIIRNYRVTSPKTTPFSAVYLEAGAFNVGTTAGNVVGNGTGIGSIYLIGVSSTSTSYGIYVNSPSTVTLSNNIIGSVSTTVTGSTTYGHSFSGIYKPAIAGSLTISGNTIGSQATTASIRASSISTGNTQSVYGIYSLGTGATNIINNVVANLLDSTTLSSASSNVEAIYFGGSTAVSNLIQRNFIYGLTHSSTAASALNLMAGIHLAAGSANVSNNILWLGNGVANNFGIFGIYDLGVSGQTNSIYHNTVYLSGTPSGTTQNTYAYYKSVNAGSTDIRNNIFFNARTGGTTGKHYALSLPGTTTLTINANDYYCSGTLYNYLSGDKTTLEAWKTATGQDLNSLNTSPFGLPASASTINFKPTVDLFGVGVGTTYDYGLIPRNSTSPTIGAWERVNKWKGSVSIDFNTATNWTFNMVPAAYDNIIFDDAPNRPCIMDQDRYVTDIVNNQATYRLIVNGFRLTIRGNMTFANGAQIEASATGSTVEFNGTSAQTIPTGSLYTNKVYNLTVNNTNNVTLNGTLVLLNTLTAASGKLNAGSVGATVSYGGTTAQTIEANSFLNEKVYNLTINNPAGVMLNTTFTADNDMTIQTGASFIIPETKGLTVTGLLTNSASASSLLLKSSATGTASLIQTSSGALATVQRYIDGDTLAWHFMSSPVASQTITGTWTPSGTNGDGTGYDLYLWDEPKSCWVYNLNADSIPAWTVANPGTAFVPGRGYLYAVQAFTPTKQFVGNLNGGTITRPLTITAAGNYKGFNLLGNPYPSSIDWSLGGGFDRNMLYLNGSGYDIWTWSSTAKNYGVYNSADASGTNNVTRYIAPMQAFFVRASTAGTFSFKNNARVHNGASIWLKSAQSYNEEQNVHLTVASSAGSDEVRFGFGYPVNESGAMKLFSPVESAPSLYMNCSGSSFSTRRLTDTSKNKYVPVNFKAGEAGTYTLNCTYDASTLGTIYLEDRLTGSILDLSGGDSYTFQASVADAAERFVLHFGAVTPVDAGVHPNVWVSAGMLNVYLENMIGDYTMRVSDLQGRLVLLKKMSGSEQCSIPLFGRGIYLVTVESKSKSQSIKVVY